LQRCERQAMWPSPYLDAFGEEVKLWILSKAISICRFYDTVKYGDRISCTDSHNLSRLPPFAVLIFCLSYNFARQDIDLRRGKPLYLSQERYSALTAMVR